MPASPSDTADTRDTDRLDEILRRFNADEGIKDDDHEWLIEQVAWLRKSRHVHCGCNLVHKPGQQLADLLRTATEFCDETTNDSWCASVQMHDATQTECVCGYVQLRAAARALQGPPAPFRPQQAHAAPAKCRD